METVYTSVVCLSGDRRANKPGGYNSELGGGYNRNYGPAEPEWFTEGPVSQSETIELHGFDGAHGERLRMRNASGSDASNDDSQREEQRTNAGGRNKDDRDAKSGSVKSNRNETCDTMSSTVLDSEQHRKNDCGNWQFFFSLLLS